MAIFIKNLWIALMSAAIILLYSCSGNNIEERAKKINDSLDSVKRVTDSISIAEKEFPKTLIIKGTNVNMRVSPDLKAVRIRQLTTGDSCEVLEKGKKQIIEDNPDYWYKVSFKGKEGWIFGAFTSARLNNNEKE